MNTQGLYSTVDVLNYLGAICNNTKILDDKKNRLNAIKDLEVNRLHRIIYGAIENIYINNDVTEVDAVALNMFLSAYPDQYGYYISNKGNELVTKIKENITNGSYEKSLETIKKFSLLRAYETVGFSVKDIYDTEIVDPVAISLQREKFDKMNEIDIRNHVKTKIDTIHENMQVDTGEMFSFHAGDDILGLIQKCKEEPTWGYSFQSKLYNRVFRGLLPKKVMIRSGSTGSGKSRQMISDMAGVSANMLYDINTHQWIKNDNPASSLFITTELDKDEVQLCLLACVSKIPEDVIKDGIYTPEVEERLLKAGQVIKESSIHFEYASNFSLTDLESLIEKSINRYDAGFVFFDYIQITPRFAQEIKKVFGYDLREDQMLNLMVSGLKNMANKYNIFILTSTQLNRSHKSDEYPDATHLRGGQATADKADYGIITMKATAKDKEKLDKLMSSNGNFTCSMPTHGHHIFKNRGGKYAGVIIWVNMNLDNMIIEDCFVTTQDFEQLYVEPKVL